MLELNTYNCFERTFQIGFRIIILLHTIYSKKFTGRFTNNVMHYSNKFIPIKFKEPIIFNFIKVNAYEMTNMYVWRCLDLIYGVTEEFPNFICSTRLHALERCSLCIRAYYSVQMPLLQSLLSHPNLTWWFAKRWTTKYRLFHCDAKY